MTAEPGAVVAEPRFGRAVWLLLRAARRRALGRQRRQRELMQRRTGRKAFSSAWLGTAAAFFLAAVLNGLAAFVVYGAVKAGERAEPERHGKMVVSAWFRDAVVQSERDGGTASWSERSAFPGIVLQHRGPYDLL